MPEVLPPPVSKPVISPIQSVLGYLQWQAFEFQITATQNPTQWYCTPIAPGLMFDDTTGTILGAATMPGVYVFTVQAENAAGLSDPVTFVMGIEASGFVQPSNIIELVIDVTTKVVSLASASGTSTSSSSDGKLSALFWVKAGDDLLPNIRFLRGGVPADLDLTGLKFALKELEPENVLVSSSAWTPVGAGDEASYRMFVHVDSDELRGALSNYEDDAATQLHLQTDVRSRYLDGGPLPVGRLGNYLSQIAIFRESVRRSYGNVLIVEDDASFCSRFVERAVRAIADLPSDWDMLYFGVWDWNIGASQPVSESIYRPGRPLLRHAVLHSAKAMPRLVEKTRQLTETIDVTLSRLTRELNIYATRARLAWQAGEANA